MTWTTNKIKYAVYRHAYLCRIGGRRRMIRRITGTGWESQFRLLTVWDCIFIGRNMEITLEERRMAKRIWWSCFMRDQILALGTHRAMLMVEQDLDVPILDIEDFRLELPSRSLRCISIRRTYIADLEKQRQVAVICVEMAKLCLHIKKILESQYSDAPVHLGCVTSGSDGILTKLTLAPKEESEVIDVLHCDGSLIAWFRQLHVANQDPVGSHDRSIIVYTSYLHMLYYIALVALHRPELIRHLKGLKRNVDLFPRSLHTLLFAAHQITSIAEKLDRLGHLRYIPTARISMLVPTMTLYLFVMERATQFNDCRCINGFRTCVRLVQTVSDRWDPVVAQFVSAACAQANATICAGDWPNEACKWASVRPQANQICSTTTAGGKLTGQAHAHAIDDLSRFLELWHDSLVAELNFGRIDT
jgi:hypothetical protein